MRTIEVDKSQVAGEAATGFMLTSQPQDAETESEDFGTCPRLQSPLQTRSKTEAEMRVRSE